jgi:hypothetical protein
MKKELLFNIPPVVSYQNLAYTIGILRANDKSINWYYNNFMQVCCDRRFLYDINYPMDYNIYNKNCSDIQIFDYESLNKHDFFLHKNDLINYIINLIDKNRYAYMWGIDTFYLDGVNQSEKLHNYHDILLIGYDKSLCLFKIAAYDVNQSFSLFNVSFKLIEQSFISEFIEQNGFVTGIKIKDDINIGLSLSDIKISLEHYLFSLNSRVMEYRSLDPYIYNDQSVFGMETHKYLKLYIQYLIEGEIEKPDMRVFRMYWEHKKIVNEKLITLENYDVTFTGLSDGYVKSVEISEKIKNLVLKSIVCKNIKSLSKIIEYINEVYDIECSILNKTLDIINCKLNN